jgi:hypothetical protein
MQYLFDDQEVMNSVLVDAVGERIKQLELDITYADLRAIVWTTVSELKLKSHPCKVAEVSAKEC